MPIAVSLVDEHGTVLHRLPGPLTNWLLQAALPPDTLCLRFIDTHGDTLFNRLQLPTLSEELDRAKPLITDDSVNRTYDAWLANISQRGPDLAAYARKSPRPTADDMLRHVADLQSLIAHALAQSHTYIRFTGD